MNVNLEPQFSNQNSFLTLGISTSMPHIRWNSAVFLATLPSPSLTLLPTSLAYATLLPHIQARTQRLVSNFFITLMLHTQWTAVSCWYYLLSHQSVYFSIASPRLPASVVTSLIYYQSYLMGPTLKRPISNPVFKLHPENLSKMNLIKLFSCLIFLFLNRISKLSADSSS